MMSLSPDHAEALAATQPAPAPAVPVRFSSTRAYAQTFAATLAVRCLGVLSGVLAARLLGPAGRGELAVVIFLPLLLITVGELELPRSLAYEASKLGEVSRQLVATGFWLAILLGGVQAVVLAVALPVCLPAEKIHLLSTSRWFVLYLPAAYITFALTGIDQGRGRFGRFSFLLVLPGILYLAAILLAWASGQISPQTFALGILAGAVVTAAVRAGMDWNTIVRTKPDWIAARRVIKQGISFYFPAIAGFVLSRADMFLLVRLAPTDAIGLYAVAQAIALGQIGAVNPFVQVGFAAVAGETNQERALQTLVRHFRLAQLVVLTAGIAAAAMAPWIIRLLFGAKFIAAVTTTYLLIGATLLWGMSQVLEQGLRAAAHPRPGIISNLLGLAVLVSMGIPGCIRFGIEGLAAALLAAQFLNLVTLISFCVAALKMPLRFLWAFNANTFRELLLAVRSLVKRMGTAQVNCREPKVG